MTQDSEPETETVTEQIRERIRQRNDELPGEWTTSIGEACGDDCYTHWYYHPKWELVVYTDPGEPHTVHLYERRPDAEREDEKTAEHPTKSERFEDEDVAQAFAEALMKQADQGNYDDTRRGG